MLIWIVGEGVSECWRRAGRVMLCVAVLGQGFRKQRVAIVCATLLAVLLAQGWEHERLLKYHFHCTRLCGGGQGS